MKFIKKLVKKAWKGIKKVGKGIFKGFKKVFKGIGKFLHKLGPIGTIGMMIAMPYLGSYLWQGFGSWAGGLSGTMGNVMKTIYNAGNSVAGAYRSITDAVYGTLKKIPGVGDALKGMDRFVDRAREWVGMEPGALPVMNDKELSTWMNSQEGLKVMGFESQAAFQQANPSFFNADGSLTSSGLNFGRGHSVAFEAHLRGKDVYKSVNGEFDYKSYSDNFNNILNEGYDNNISNFGKQFEGINSVNLRSGAPATTREYKSALKEATKDLTPEELKSFYEKGGVETFKSNFDKQPRKLYDAPTGLFGEQTGSVSLENIPSRYRHVAFDAENNPFIKRGTKLGASVKTPLMTQTTTAVVAAATDDPGYGVEPDQYGPPEVAPLPTLEPAGVDRGVISASNFPQTFINLNYQNLLKVPEVSMQNLAAGGVYMPQTNLPQIEDYKYV